MYEGLNQDFRIKKNKIGDNVWNELSCIARSKMIYHFGMLFVLKLGA